MLTRDDDRHDELFSPPPGTWSMIAVHDGRHMVLPLNGNRSIFAPWPPQSFCEGCGRFGSAGYVGPAHFDRAYFPSALLHTVCEPCARSWLELRPDELTGHVCSARCSDRLHLELVDADAATGLTAASTDAHPVVTQLRARGWRIADLDRPPRRWPNDGAMVRVWIEPARQLPWVTTEQAERWFL